MSVSIAKKFKGLLFIFFLCRSAHADSRLVLNLTNLPQTDIALIKAEAKKDPDEFLPDNTTPGSVAMAQLEGFYQQFLTPKLSGFPALYAGYITISSPEGLIVFPLRHAQQKLYVAITPDIKLIHVKGSSFSHAEYSPDPNVPLALYKYEKLEDNKQQAYWHVTKISKPDNARINPISVVILTHPNNIYVPEGDFIATASEQLVIPPVRIIGNQDKELINMRLLDIQQYFETVKKDAKRANDTTVVKITTTF